MTIQNNTVSNTSGSGIKVLHFNSNGNLRAKIVNNTVGAPAQPNPGIAIENGSSNDPAFNPTLCAQISGNPATGSGPDGFGNTFPGIDLIERGNSNTTYRLQIHGLTPNPATPLRPRRTSPARTRRARWAAASTPASGPRSRRATSSRPARSPSRPLTRGA